VVLVNMKIIAHSKWLTIIKPITNFGVLSQSIHQSPKDNLTIAIFGDYSLLFRILF